MSEMNPMNQESVDRSISIAEAAQTYPVSEQTLRNWIKSGSLPTVEHAPGESGPLRVQVTALETLLSKKGKLKGLDVKAAGDSTESPAPPLEVKDPAPLPEEPTTAEADASAVPEKKTAPHSSKSTGPHQKMRAPVPPAREAKTRRNSGLAAKQRKAKSTTKLVKNSMRKFDAPDLINIRDWILHRLDSKLLQNQTAQS